MRKFSIIVMLLASVFIFNSCETEGDQPSVVELQKQVDQLKSVLDTQTKVSDVSFEGSEMILKFANGTEIRTEAPTTIMPYIGENGNWFVNGKDLGSKAQADMPSIGSNGNWWIGETDTAVKAEGPKGTDGADGADGTGISNVAYDPTTAKLTLTLTDDSKYEFVLFYKDNLEGRKLGDINGKYLLTGISNGDVPFAEFVYNADNQMTDINYYSTLLNAPVKTGSLHREFNAEGKVASQTFTQICTKDKAEAEGWEVLPGIQEGISLTYQEAFEEIFPNGIENYSGTSINFFNYYHANIIKGNYLYVSYYHSEVRKFLIRNDVTKQFGISESESQKYIWTPRYYYWENSWSAYNSTSAYDVTNITSDNNNNIQFGDNSSLYFYRCCTPAIATNSSEVDEIDGHTLYDYIGSRECENPENITGNYKTFFREYTIYKAGDEIEGATFVYSYDGDDYTVNQDVEEDENDLDLYTIKVVDDKIDMIIYHEEAEESNGDEVTYEDHEILKLNYKDSKLTSISSPYYEVEDVVKVVYDNNGNPIEYQVNSKKLVEAGMDEDALVALGLAYETEAYDSELGMVVVGYTYPEEFAPVLKVNYDYSMKNFMNHTWTAMNPLYSVFNSENAFQEIIWAGHGSCFVAEYLAFNDGGYPTKFKAYLQLSPEYEIDEPGIPVNGSVATTYKLSYKQIEE